MMKVVEYYSVDGGSAPPLFIARVCKAGGFDGQREVIEGFRVVGGWDKFKAFARENDAYIPREETAVRPQPSKGGPKW